MHIIEQLIEGSGSFSPINYVEDDERFDQIGRLSADSLNVPSDKLVILEPFENDYYYLWQAQALESGAFYLFISNKSFEDVEHREQTLEQVQNNIKICRS